MTDCPNCENLSAELDYYQRRVDDLLWEIEQLRDGLDAMEDRYYALRDKYE